MQRILIIDDDKRVADTARSILEAEGYAVVAAENGSAGIGATQDGRFDLAIVDLFMPGIDGLETTKELRRRAPVMPIVVMSASCFAANVRKCRTSLQWSRRLGRWRRSTSRSGGKSS
jgi:CheY-like chemotaxis protein